MFLAILSYRPIFSTFLDDSQTNTASRQVASEQMVHRAAELINGSDSIVKAEKFVLYANGVKEKLSTVDTVRIAANTEGRKPVTISSQKTLPKSLYWKFVGLVFLLILYVTMVYGPIAAFLVELFPTRIRYTSMSLPYHIGNGVFGGLVPFIGLLLTTTYTSDPLVGLWYPIGVTVLCLLIGTLYLRNHIDKKIND
jgi:hypothetical protein